MPLWTALSYGLLRYCQNIQLVLSLTQCINRFQSRFPLACGKILLGALTGSLVISVESGADCLLKVKL